jgi:ketosteroid isomerase-like protein
MPGAGVGHIHERCDDGAMDRDESAIRQLEDERYDALVRGDFDVFERIAHPSLLYTHSTAETDTLESYLDRLRSGYFVYHSIDHPIERIVIEGDTALVLGSMNADITAGGEDRQLRNLTLAVWIRRDDTWRLLAFHPTRRLT